MYPRLAYSLPEPSSGDHYTLLPLTGDPSICIRPLSVLVAAKLTVASKHGRGNMGVQLKLPSNFTLQLNGGELSDEPVFSQGPIQKNEELIIHGDDNNPMIVNGETVAMESTINVAPVDQYTPVQCALLTSVAYEPKYANDTFTFKETVAEMQQHYEKERS